MMYSEYSQQLHAKGESILRAHQYAKALGSTHKGDNTLLIWLGKTRLKQMEAKQEENTEPPKVVFEVNYNNDSNDKITISPKTLPTTDSSSTK